MHPWLDTLLDELEHESQWSYEPGGVLAAEPTALAALALAGHGRLEAADRVCARLAVLQAADGSVAITAAQPTPCWPTGWAVLAWSTLHSSSGEANYRDSIDRAMHYVLSLHGRACQRPSETGHNTQLDGWPWVEDTHPWIEPTAINVLALKVTGHRDHPRTREAVAMLIDRLLPDGGCNYGNTFVLGQTLRPHLEPTGLALAALAGETDASGRMERSLAYLRRAIGNAAGGISLAYGLLGLAAHRQRPSDAEQRLAAAAKQNQTYLNNPLRKALLALAAAPGSPLRGEWLHGRKQ